MSVIRHTFWRPRVRNQESINMIIWYILDNLLVIIPVHRLMLKGVCPLPVMVISVHISVLGSSFSLLQFINSLCWCLNFHWLRSFVIRIFSFKTLSFKSLLLLTGSLKLQKPIVSLFRTYCLFCLLIDLILNLPSHSLNLLISELRHLWLFFLL